MNDKQNKLIDSFKSSPFFTIKWDNYFEVYEKVLKRFENKKITIVEIGVGNGGSLFMWKSFFKENSRIIGIELNPDAKKLEKHGFEIYIGDQTDKNFWKKFYKEVGNIDILLDDGGHRNLQQVTSVMESINYINDSGMIIVEDTHTSYMKKMGFKNPSKHSFINFCNLIIESLHRRNPMTKKDNNVFSNRIHSIEFFDSITVMNIASKLLEKSTLLENNIDIREWFVDYRNNGYFIKTIEKFRSLFGTIEEGSLFYKFIRKIFHRNPIFSWHERKKLKDYFKKVKK
tara:strand:- start:281 stop:1138 length:858 start_codon:yes stop_codon:yes gene_type:complete